MGKTAAIPMDKEIQNFLFIFTGQQYLAKDNKVKIRGQRVEGEPAFSFPAAKISSFR